MCSLKLQIPNNFYQEERRCDYTVTSEMKEVWAVEMDLLTEFDRVCKVNDIKYFACAGTVLGAVRHKGFIPWDDDIDVMMLRSEYEKLCSIAGNSFEKPYFFQTEYTDPGSIRGHAQLRNSLTTGIVKNDYQFRKKIPFNQGIFIDIFPLDNIPDSPDEEKKFFKQAIKMYGKAERYRNYYYGINWNTGLKKAIKSLLGLTWKVFHHNYNNTAYGDFEKYIQKNNDIATDRVGIVILRNKRFVFNKTLLGNPRYFPFEFISIPVPEYYEAYLTSTYGDWHKFVKGGSMHHGVIYDTRRPYTQLL